MNKIIQLGNLREDLENFSNPQTGRIYSVDGIAPTLNTCQGGDRQPKVLVNMDEMIIDDTYGYEKSNRYYDDYSPALRSERHGLKTVTYNEAAGRNKSMNDKPNTAGYRIRKLTPRECWRLMGFSDEAFNKAKWYSKEECEKLLQKYPKHKGKRQFTEEQRIERMSDTQLYKQAGNSIVTDVLYYIFKELYAAMPYLFEDLRVSSYFSGIGAFEIALNKLFDDINSENFQTPQVNRPTVVD